MTNVCAPTSPCSAKHCVLCKKGDVHWFHLPADYKVGRPRHKRGAIREYFGF